MTAITATVAMNVWLFAKTTFNMGLTDLPFGFGKTHLLKGMPASLPSILYHYQPFWGRTFLSFHTQMSSYLSTFPLSLEQQSL